MKKIILPLIFSLAMPLWAIAQDDATINKTGDKAPVFSCTTLDGKKFDLANTSGKIVMINFFATWCGPCNEELPVLQKDIWDKYKDNPDFVLLVIGRQHTDEEIKEFATKKGLSLPFAADPKKEIYSLYAKQMIPRNIIIGRDGKIVLQEIGFFPDDFKKITDLLAKELVK
jgi:peroxiredoxin